MRASVLWLGIAAAFSVHAADTQPRSIRCDFVDAATKTWDDGRFATSKEKLSLIYDSIDVPQRSARLIGNAGATDVYVFLTDEGLHFLEITASGNVTLTTAFKSSGRPAAHSRHVNLDSGPVVSQYHGHCRPY
jgi:hypothetical protein